MRPETVRPGGGTRRTSDSAVTLLPQPDSPTSPSVSPSSTWNETLSTARTSPPTPGKCVDRSETSRRRGTVQTTAAGRYAPLRRLVLEPVDPHQDPDAAVDLALVPEGGLLDLLLLEAGLDRAQSSTQCVDPLEIGPDALLDGGGHRLEAVRAAQGIDRV